MAAPIMDKLIPTAVFIVSLMATLVLVTVWMTPTINANQDSSIDPIESYGNPDYLTTMYENGTYVVWDPNPLHVNYTMAINNWFSEGSTAKTATFTSSYAKEGKDIAFWAIKDYWWSISSEDTHQLKFMQHGGWLGAEKYADTVQANEWITTYNDSASPYWYCNIQLRHNYLVTLAPTYGNDTWTAFNNWTFDLRIEHLINGSQKVDAWTVVMQLFTFSLPGVPQFISLMLVVPVMVSVALVTYALVRSLFPF